MENKEEKIAGFEYNTGRKALKLPEYGRNVQKMVLYLKTIEDREKRNEQARAVVKVMELLNPSVHLEDDFEHKLWDHLYIIADFDLDVDSPYPMPQKESMDTLPERIPLEKKPMKASHYGRYVEANVDLIAGLEDGETKDYLLRNLATFMRMQYLKWNKDTVSDETIFADIEKLSDGRIVIPDGFEYDKVKVGNVQYQNNGQNRSGKNRHKHQNRKK
ncbi:MAG: DUF4290 domain-containing protein [Bacteroidales bacterium]|nr:DUF4290 domain-containing protein [Bacteroidales bacterium]